MIKQNQVVKKNYTKEFRFPQHGSFIFTSLEYISHSTIELRMTTISEVFYQKKERANDFLWVYITTSIYFALSRSSSSLANITKLSTISFIILQTFRSAPNTLLSKSKSYANILPQKPRSIYFQSLLTAKPWKIF